MCRVVPAPQKREPRRFETTGGEGDTKEEVREKIGAGRARGDGDARPGAAVLMSRGECHQLEETLAEPA